MNMCEARKAMIIFLLCASLALNLALGDDTGQDNSTILNLNENNSFVVYNTSLESNNVSNLSNVVFTDSDGNLTIIQKSQATTAAKAVPLNPTQIAAIIIFITAATSAVSFADNAPTKSLSSALEKEGTKVKVAGTLTPVYKDHEGWWYKFSSAEGSVSAFHPRALEHKVDVEATINPTGYFEHVSHKPTAASRGLISRDAEKVRLVARIKPHSLNQTENWYMIHIDPDFAYLKTKGPLSIPVTLIGRTKKKDGHAFLVIDRVVN